MTNFPVHTIDSAPEAGAMATSPVLIKSLVALFGNVHGGSFTEPQIPTVLLTNAVVNACTWTVAFHTAFAAMNTRFKLLLISGCAVSAAQFFSHPAPKSQEKLRELSELRSSKSTRRYGSHGGNDLLATRCHRPA
jgi:hypothetical protein